MPPTKPNHPCSTPGCPALVAQGSRCPAHQAAHYRQQDAGRPSASQRGYDRRWRWLRQHVLLREPLCRACAALGRVTPATEVDHIIPIRAGGARLDVSNLASICKSCHSAKTMRESVNVR